MLRKSLPFPPHLYLYLASSLSAPPAKRSPPLPPMTRFLSLFLRPLFLMAVIPVIPNPAVIKAARGVLDFYVWRGLAVVRSWPNKPVLPRSPAVQAAGQAFGTYSRDVNATSGMVRAAAIAATAETNWTWKDVMTRAAYGHLISW